MLHAQLQPLQLQIRVRIQTYSAAAVHVALRIARLHAQLIMIMSGMTNTGIAEMRPGYLQLTVLYVH